MTKCSRVDTTVRRIPEITTVTIVSSMVMPLPCPSVLTAIPYCHVQICPTSLQSYPKQKERSGELVAGGVSPARTTPLEL